ncbi:HNH endonuclease [Gryllotalpicola daejeonensis]|uniref:HNH endonuclease n=1 Tax=Gryllotalpicola daejeonensis TaxID=993087 RepID=UPI0031D1E418
MKFVDQFDATSGVDPGPGLRSDELAQAARPWILDRLREVEAECSALAVRRVRLVGRLGEEAMLQAALNVEVDPSREADRERNLQWRSAALELAASSNVSTDVAQRTLAEAWTLTQKCEITLQAVEAGEIGFGHAQAIAREVADLDVLAAGAAQEALLPYAKRLSVGLFARKAREVLDAKDPERLADRYRRAYAARHVEVEGGRNGMATVTAHLDAADAAVIGTGLHNAALELQAAGDERSRRQIEADLFVELLMEGEVIVGASGGTAADEAAPVTEPVPVAEPAKPRTVRDHAPISVELLVPAATAAGGDDAPGKIQGVGMIDPVKARQLIARAPSLRRILTGPISSAIIDFDRTTYRVPAELKRMILLRDEHCRAPNCPHPAKELDHTIDYARGGKTARANLAGFCANHHHVKHEAGWSVTQFADGVLDWIGPTRRHYRTRSDLILPAEPPPAWDDYADDAPFDAPAMDDDSTEGDPTENDPTTAG